MKKRLFALALSLVMALSLLPAGAVAAETGFYVQGCYESAEGIQNSGGPLTELVCSVGKIGQFRFFVGETKLDVTSVTSSNENVAFVREHIPDKFPNEKYYVIEFNGLGSAELTVAAGTDTYRVDVTVSLPQVALYTECRMAEDCLAIGDRNTIKYYDLNEGAVWLMRADGFTQEQADAVTVYDMDTQDPLDVIKTNVAREGGTTYDVKLVLPKPTSENGYDFELRGDFNNIRAGVIGAATCGPAQIANGEYTVGFGFPGEGTAVSIFDGYGWNKRTAVNEDPENPYEEHCSLKIFAGKKMSEGVNGYEDASSVVSFSVTKMGVDVFSGPEYAFSFDPDNFVAETSGAVGELLYYKTGYLAEGRVWADVSVTYNEQITNHRVSMTVSVEEEEDLLVYTPKGNSLEDLNALLITLAKKAQAAIEIDQDSEKTYTVNLPATEYSGSIVIPDGFQNNQRLNLHGVKDLTGETRTVIKGGINLNGTSVGGISNITFQGDEATDDKAIFGGKCEVSQCAFYDYDVALKSSSAGMISVTWCLFVDNGVAYSIDVADVPFGLPGYPDRNTFVDNDTAIQVLSLNEQINPFNFRPVENTFIDNTTDFNVKCEGTFYFYKNYFGTKVAPEMDRAEFLARFGAAWTTKEITALTTRCKANISAGSGVTVIANPCRSLPATAWWHFYQGVSPETLFPGASAYLPDAEATEMPYWAENVLTSSWETETQIINDKSDELKLDASAFASGGKKVIDVVEATEDQETPLGTWTFDEGGNA